MVAILIISPKSLPMFVAYQSMFDAYLPTKVVAFGGTKFSGGALAKSVGTTCD